MVTFKVGDQVIIKKNSYYAITTGGQKGTIISIGQTRGRLEYTVSFDNKDWVKMHKQAELRTRGDYSRENHTFYILPEYLEHSSKRSKEDRVQEHIKTLWNNSNWVKKHPQFAY